MKDRVTGVCRTAPAMLGLFIILYIYNRPGGAGAVLHTAVSLIHLLSDPFSPDLQNIINLKLKF